jgi:hypothetical protein
MRLLLVVLLNLSGSTATLLLFEMVSGAREGGNQSFGIPFPACLFVCSDCER